MLRLNKVLSLGLGLLTATSLLVSCVRDKEFFPKDSGDKNRGQIVGISGGGDDKVVGVFRDVNPTNEEFAFITITRSPSTQAQLNAPLTVKVIKNDALRTAYNTAHSSSFVDLPTDAYSLTGNLNTITFEPGETVKTINIKLDKSKLDLSKQYAVGYTISETGSGGQLSVAQKNVLYNVGVKNPYDGVYSVVSGNVIRYTAPGVAAGDALSGSLAGNPDVTLATVGATTVEISGLQWAAQGGGVGGINNLRATVNPTTNQVTMTSIGAPSLTNWAGKENKYDPATKTFYLAFRWNPTTTTREYEVVLKYKGPR